MNKSVDGAVKEVVPLDQKQSFAEGCDGADAALERGILGSR
jgi:hypothetical protein